MTNWSPLMFPTLSDTFTCLRALLHSYIPRTKRGRLIKVQYPGKLQVLGWLGETGMLFASKQAGRRGALGPALRCGVGGPARRAHCEARARAIHPLQATPPPPSSTLFP